MNIAQMKLYIDKELSDINKRIAKIEKELFGKAKPDDTDRNALKNFKAEINENKMRIVKLFENFQQLKNTSDERINKIIGELSPMKIPTNKILTSSMNDAIHPYPYRHKTEIIKKENPVTRRFSPIKRKRFVGYSTVSIKRHIP